MADITDQVCPGDAVGRSDEPGVGDGPEGLADVGGVGYVAVGGEEDCAEARGVGCIAKVGVCGFFCAGRRGG